MKQASRSHAWVSDEDLVAGVLAGSREHFDRLYETYFERVYRFALKRLDDPEEAEEVTRAVFVAVCNALPNRAGEPGLAEWILGITRNEVNRRLCLRRRLSPERPSNE